MSEQSPCAVLGMPDLAQAFPSCFVLKVTAVIVPSDVEPGFTYAHLNEGGTPGQRFGLAVFDVTRWPREHHYGYAACEAWFDEVIQGAPRGASLPLQHTWRAMLTWLEDRYPPATDGLIQGVVLEAGRFRELHRWVAMQFVETGEPPALPRIHRFMDDWGDPAPCVLRWIGTIGGTILKPESPPSPPTDS